MPTALIIGASRGIGLELVRQYVADGWRVIATARDDDGWRVLLADPGLRSVEVTVGGISSDQVLLAAIMAASVASATVTVQLPTTTGTLAGSYLISSFEQTGEHDGAVEFSATFMSSGVVTYTAGT